MSIFEMDRDFVMNTYDRYPLCLVRGKGVWVWDSKGKKYLDMMSGIAVNGLGHAHPSVLRALREQSAKLMHASNLFYTEPQPRLARELVALSGMKKAFFCNSGTEANEAAIKIARKYTGRKKFIAFEHCFHGRTVGALSLTWKEKYRKPFEPLMPGVSFAPYNDLESVKKLADNETAAIFVEPVQGEAGVIPAKPDFLRGLREICDEKKILLVFDEVQTAFRTGKLFGFQTFRVKPDIVTLAKTLGAGFPIGALLASEKVCDTFAPGEHAATFGGNPLACAVALAALKELKKLAPQAGPKGEYFLSLLKSIKSPLIEDVRGLGLMFGIDLVSKEKRDSFLSYCRDNGLLLCASGDTTARFLPPLIVKKPELKLAYERLKGFFS